MCAGRQECSVLERLRLNLTLSSIPVIVISGRDRHANRARALKEGAKAFLQKPTDIADLLALVGTILADKDDEETVVDHSGYGEF
jgi:DNA-binding response OmpR family regulator